MLSERWICGLALAALVTLGTGPAAAQPAVLNPTAQGAALVLPYLTATPVGDRITVATVTNGAPTARNLHLLWINGSNWSAIDRDCPLTPWETTYFVFERDGDGARVTYECSDIGQEFPDPSDTNNIHVATGLGAEGIFFVAQECQPGQLVCAGQDANERTLYDDVLTGDATVMDFGQGLAFSVSAVHLQGVAGTPGVTGDRFYQFNGMPLEYRSFPSMLAANYIAPDAATTAELMLFTLDGRVNGGPGINAAVSGDAYDDDENPTSGGVTFDCFTVQDISEDPPTGWGTNVTREVSDGLVGHLELNVTTAVRTDIHELTPFPFGGGDPAGPPSFSRFAPVHGWLVQTIATGGTIDPTADASNPGAWARSLNQGTLALAPLGGDRPSLDAGPARTTTSTTSTSTSSTTSTSTTSTTSTSTTTTSSTSTSSSSTSSTSTTSTTTTSTPTPTTTTTSTTTTTPTPTTTTSTTTTTTSTTTAPPTTTTATPDPAGAPCDVDPNVDRFENRGTTTCDHQTGYLWEKKTDDGSIHDKDNTYTWNPTFSGTTPTGTAFTTFLPGIDGFAGVPACVTPATGNCESADGVAVTCDTDPGTRPTGCWRLPEIDELQTILLEPDPCGTNPCIGLIFGPTASSFYWSATSSTFGTGNAWGVFFDSGSVNADFTSDDNHVRAVRVGP